jgi:hypothetical protein
LTEVATDEDVATLLEIHDLAVAEAERTAKGG